ncbi:hypothetical protein QBC46DRAFT_413063 [Diplogelasinospora grovesii]|uniref:Zn(2)-C6 fungal-type domain-containing protein n=1 Tax=Diplogelasinospora grovesii TaxID=303347 RepID=A0AAN6S0D3_9PEZI|nr:hypothetical protein QBC46DRAFT_413063 [Diplogelasinospora grovesii]
MDPWISRESVLAFSETRQSALPGRFPEPIWIGDPQSACFGYRSDLAADDLFPVSLKVSKMLAAGYSSFRPIPSTGLTALLVEALAVSTSQSPTSGLCLLIVVVFPTTPRVALQRRPFSFLQHSNPCAATGPMVRVPKHKDTSSGPTRRSHRKSRNGCKECKKRHVKCDEHRPICVNCSTAKQHCSYLDQPLTDGTAGLSRLGFHSESDTPTSSSISTASSPLCLAAAATGAADDQSGSSSRIPDSDQQVSAVFSLSHLALLHHLETVMARLLPFFTPGEPDAHACYEMLLTSALSAPYLMDELLALAALHLSTLQSDAAAKAHRQHQAAELQARALVLFNAAGPEIRDEDCTAMFIFSALLGLHLLFDAVASHKDFADFLDRFIQYLGLHRNVRIFARRGWHIIRHTELKPVLDRIEETTDRPQPQPQPRLADDAGSACDRLVSLLGAPSDSLGSAPSQACYEAIQSLRWVMDQHRALPAPYQTHVVLAWPVLISPEYIEALKQRRPEALVILAHWGVLLHLDRDFWMFGEAGRLLIESIARHLGAYWDEWLAWPKEVLRVDAV